MTSKWQNIDLWIGLAIGAFLSVSAISLFDLFGRESEERKEDIVKGVPGLIGQ